MDRFSFQPKSNYSYSHYQQNLRKIQPEEIYQQSIHKIALQNQPRHQHNNFVPLPYQQDPYYQRPEDIQRIEKRQRIPNIPDQKQLYYPQQNYYQAPYYEEQRQYYGPQQSLYDRNNIEYTNYRPQYYSNRQRQMNYLPYEQMNNDYQYKEEYMYYPKQQQQYQYPPQTQYVNQSRAQKRIQPPIKRKNDDLLYVDRRKLQGEPRQLNYQNLQGRIPIQKKHNYVGKQQMNSLYYPQQYPKQRNNHSLHQNYQYINRKQVPLTKHSYSKKNPSEYLYPQKPYSQLSTQHLYHNSHSQAHLKYDLRNDSRSDLRGEIRGNLRGSRSYLKSDPIYSKYQGERMGRHHSYGLDPKLLFYR